MPFEKLSDQRTGEPSEKARERVEAAHAIQRERFAYTGLQTNVDMGPGEIRQFSPIDQTNTNLLKAAIRQMQLSVRAYHRILKLARTIADLAGEADIQAPHITEAIQSHREAAHYRPRRQI